MCTVSGALPTGLSENVLLVLRLVLISSITVSVWIVEGCRRCSGKCGLCPSVQHALGGGLAMDFGWGVLMI